MENILKKQWPDHLQKYKNLLDEFIFEPKTGIYFLFENEELIYIGQAKDIYMRVLRHSKHCLFDKIWHIPLDGDLDIIEAQFIQHFRPKLNITDNPDNHPKRHKKTSKPIINSQKKPKTQKQPSKYKLTDLPSILANAPWKSLHDVLGTLTAVEKSIIIKRHGLCDYQFHTLQEIADFYHLSRERIRQIQRKAERKLLHPSRIKKLFGL